MRIAYVLTEFPSISQTFVLKQITGLIDLGHDIEIFALTSSCNHNCHPDVIRYKLLNKTTYFPPVYSSRLERFLHLLKAISKYIFRYPKEILGTLNFFRFGRMSFNSSLLNKILPFLGKEPFDIIHCHFGPMGNIAIQCKRHGVLKGKIVTSFHGYDLTGYIRSHGSNVYDMLFKYGDLFLPISFHWQKKLLDMGCDASKIKVHRMGVDVGKFQFKKYIPQKKTHIKLVSIARLVEKKGIKYSIRAVYHALKKYPNIEYNIVGDGPLFDELRELVSQLGIKQQIKFCGWMNQDEIAYTLSQSDILIAPSVTSSSGDQEGIPVVLMEALSMGLPVVSTNHSGIPELVIDGTSGFIVPEKSIDGLAQKLIFCVHLSFKSKYVQAYFNNDKLNTNLEELFYSLAK